MALKVMAGQSPGSVPFGGEKAYITAYDWRELKRWNIPEKMVRSESEMRYRVSSFWEAHRSATLGAITLIVVEIILVFGLFVNFMRRRKAERSLKEREERLSLAAMVQSNEAGGIEYRIIPGDGKVRWSFPGPRPPHGVGCS